ncbi:hypothetical protein ASE63_20240 [Bosea sp. Root381]|uniref:hypothetical protein n=1 Tax=Bosea sp. Root381 TaxID=1736524 RepID=UPI0006F3AD82|nr:hypothetical protein [Bosea sp. Root381]KRE11289.1 hypothetical protein ASE63_20240 [Bosea sp. Root381]
MNAQILMVVLTTMSGGGLSSAFVGTGTLTECQERLERVRLIINQGSGAGPSSLARSGCFSSAQSFEDFSHGLPEDAPSYVYRVVLSGERATMTKHDSAAECLRAAASGETGDQYCTQSRQNFRENAR